MKDNASLFWVDWRLARRMTTFQSSGRFVLLFLLAFAFLSLLLSGGTARYLSSNYAITALLKESASREEAIGLAKKVAALPHVRSAEYRDPAVSWKEFVQAYPGIESIPGAGDNPLPGYIEVRLRHDRFTLASVRTVVSVLSPLGLVDRVIAGEDALPEVFKLERAANALLLAGFALFIALFFIICRLQERLRSASLARDFEFLSEHGVTEGRIAGSRALGTAVSGGLLAAAAAGAAAATMYHLIGRYPSLGDFIGPREEIFSNSAIVAAAGFVLLAAVLFAGASLLGWTPLRPAGDR